jgi:hypothetical protein
MAQYTVQTASPTGVEPTFSAVTSSDTFANNGETVLQIKNGGASSITATLVSAVQCNQGFSHDLTVDVAAGMTKAIGGLSMSRFNDPSTGLVTVNYSDTTTVTACVLKV